MVSRPWWTTDWREIIKRVHALVAAAGLAAFTLALTASCASGSARGQNLESAEGALRQIPGVQSADVSIRKNTSGLTVTNSNRALIVLHVKPEASQSTFTKREVDFILQTGWSLRADRELADGVSIGVEGNDDINVGRLLSTFGWVQTGQPVPGKQVANVPADLLRRAFGKWPAEPAECLPGGSCASLSLGASLTSSSSS